MRRITTSCASVGRAHLGRQDEYTSRRLCVSSIWEALGPKLRTLRVREATTRTNRPASTSDLPMREIRGSGHAVGRCDLPEGRYRTFSQPASGKRVHNGLQTSPCRRPRLELHLDRMRYEPDETQV